MKKLLVCLLILISILSFIACGKSTQTVSEVEISRYIIELKKEKINCLFNSLFQYLATDEEQESFYTQKGQAKYLDGIENMSNVYLLKYHDKEFYVDFILLSNKNNLRTFYLKIAGEREFVDFFVKEIKNRCRIEGIESIKGTDRDLIKWDEVK
ncbi:MAG: hypothetical protein MUP30_07065 [Deltaproteobacteria bacterium]|nr:hypothetical protein [Deltaproteobacteria bacterium]